MEETKQETKKKPTLSAKKAPRQFTKAHRIVLYGLIGSGMNTWEGLKVILALKTERQAQKMADWFFMKLQRTDNFPPKEEVLEKAREITRLKIRV